MMMMMMMVDDAERRRPQTKVKQKVEPVDSKGQNVGFQLNGSCCMCARLVSTCACTGPGR
jgi:hypothetical protein